MDRAEILSTAESLINGDRDKDYGDAAENFDRIAKLWEPIFGVTVTATQVALAMNQVKVARLCAAPDHGDSWIDGAGYLALGGEIATDAGATTIAYGVPGPMEAGKTYSARTARVVSKLTEDCRDAEWLCDDTGSRYRWANDQWEFYDELFDWVPSGRGFASTFIEIID